jgi:hypothetical protein
MKTLAVDAADIAMKSAMVTVTVRGGNRPAFNTLQN